MADTSSVQNTVERARALRAKARRSRADAERAAAMSLDVWERAQKALEETQEALGRAADRTAKALAPTRPQANAG